MEIEYNKFAPIVYNGKQVFVYGDIMVSYTERTDTWGYPLGSAGRGTQTVPEVESFDLHLTVVDENGDFLFEGDDVPQEIRKPCVKKIDQIIDDLVAARM